MLKVRYLSYRRNHRFLFKNFTLSVTEGQCKEISGPNGCGKTTLLKIIAGLISPTHGKVKWLDRGEVSSTGIVELERFFYLGHRPAMRSSLTSLENLAFSPCGHLLKLSKAIKVLAAVGLVDKKNELAKNLSAGQQRRLSLAFLLMTSAPLWILDEPFTSLDNEGNYWLEELCLQHLKKNGSIIMTNHFLSPFVNTISEKISLLDYAA